jgi:hypothetical protein
LTPDRAQAGRKRDQGGALRVSRADAARLGLTDGGRDRLITWRGSAEVLVEMERSHAAGPPATAQRLGPRSSRRGRPPDRHGRRAERSDISRRARPLGRCAVAEVRPSTPRRLLNRTVSSSWVEEWPSHPLDGFDAASQRRRRVSNGHPARAVSRRMPELTRRTRWNATPRLVPLLTLRTRLRRLFSADPR